MGHSVILDKTDKGYREVSTREYKLDAQLRAILIVIDGKTTYGDLLYKFREVDNIEAGIEALIVHGFIQEAIDS
ncbi:MAG: hypothetical protein GY820_08025 [Gammaproteobacteria bacterium]|nr:hypothetical protein [Gammaproteobacteria bacterium]